MNDLNGKRTAWLVLPLLAVLFACFSTATFGATFTNASAITINDADVASPYPSAINVSGLTGTITNVKVTINGYSHTFSDDVGMVLVGPTGAALAIQDGAGDDPDMVNITYSFDDSAANPLPNLTAWPAGTYKPTAFYAGDEFPAPGPGTVYGNPGPAGGGTATFASTFNGTAPNGTWNLFVADFVGGDDGGISGGWTIEITTSAAPNVQHVVDMNGDGKTDWSVVRNTGGGPGGQITWFTQYAGVAGTQTNAWGIASDFFVPGDFDGDNKSDISIYRPGAGGSAGWYTLQSSTGTLRADTFGVTGDDPRVFGDYDGDGKDDIAVYRAGASAGTPSFWYWRTTQGGPVFAKQWGQNGDFPAPGDYDGDGKNDFVVQRNAGGGQARFWRLFATGSSDSLIFGTPTDVILPGDYDGDGKTDVATIRGVGGQILWWVHPSGGGADTSLFWGNSATDFPVQGDYDGDGKTDQAIWRPNADPTQNFYYVNKSSGGGLLSFEWGQNGDYPVANYNAH
jgi:hypothetical protein